jgi:FkbM family methyltransferase
MKKITNTFLSVFESNYFKLFGKAKHGELNYRLFKTLIKCLGINNWENSHVSGENWVIKSLLKQYGFKNAGIFFDVGANVGNYAKEVLASYPNTQGFLFEPHPASFNKLKSDSALNFVNKFNIALGERNEKLKFYDRADIEGSEHASLYSEAISGIHQKVVVEIEVEVQTLDLFCKERQISQIDFLKIDTEGHELSVLKGASHLISKKNIKLIQFEFNEMNVVSRTYMRDFLGLLANYQLHRLLPDGLLPLNNYVQDTEIFGFQNIVAILK